MRKLPIKVRSLAIVAAALAAVTMMADCIRRQCYQPSTTKSISVEGDFLRVSTNGNVDQTKISYERPEDPETGVILGSNSRRLTSADLSTGYLALYSDGQAVPEPPVQRMVVLGNVANSYYSVADDEMELDSEAAANLNKMMADYHTATGLDDFVVYRTQPTYTDYGLMCPRTFAESASGYTVDLVLQGIGGYLNYDGFDEEGWVVQNCAKYGFIVRYPEGKYEITGQKYCPWHLRYVGKTHAALMEKNGMCLEEYIDFLKGYTKDEPYRDKVGSSTYEIYTISAQGENTEAEVPRMNGEVSGDNRNTFIITTKR